MDLIEALESGRQDFLNAVDGLTEPASLAKASPDRWSVIECIEHVVIVEQRFQSWLDNGASVASVRRPENEARLFEMVTDRSSKVTAPEAVVPSGRFTSLAEALVAFTAARDRSLKLVKDRGEALYEVGAKHSRFGDLNGIEIVHVLVGHARRHAAQIREIRAAMG